MSPPREVLEALAQRYEVLADLRRRDDRGEPRPEPITWKRLAADHPGSLRELDTLPMEILEARAAALRLAAAGGEIAPWMILLAEHRALLRAALWIKRSLGRHRSLDDTRAGALGREATARFGVDADAGFVRGVARPPRGRLEALVLARLARDHGLPAEEIARAISPASRLRSAR